MGSLLVLFHTSKNFEITPKVTPQRKFFQNFFEVAKTLPKTQAEDLENGGKSHAMQNLGMERRGA